MKILFVCNYKQGAGAISGQVDLLRQNLESAGYETALFNTRGNVLKRSTAFFRLMWTGRNADVIHAHGCSDFGFFPILLSIYAAQWLHKRVVVTYHGGNALQFFRRYPRFLRFTLCKAAEVVVLTGFLEHIFGKYGVPVQVIPNIVTLDEQVFKLREKIEPKFISIRSLDKLYNVLCTIKAFALTKKRYPQATLAIAGDGDRREVLKNYVADNRLEGVTFVGKVDNAQIYNYLNEADVFLSSPHIDNMPVSVLEAFNAGLLVISSRVGGVPYMIEDGKNGYLFPDDHPDEMAKKMILTLENQEKTKQMTLAARESLKQYQWQAVKEKWTAVYKG